MEHASAQAEDWISGVDGYEPSEEAEEIPYLDDFDDEPAAASADSEDDLDDVGFGDEDPPTAAEREAAEEMLRVKTAQQQVIPGISTGALLEAMEKPEVFAELARGDLYVQMHHMRRASMDPRFTPNQRMEYSKFLAELGRVRDNDRDGSTFGNLPMIQMVFPGSGQTVQLGGKPVERDVTPAVPEGE
jgi:hypothetical protein